MLLVPICDGPVHEQSWMDVMMYIIYVMVTLVGVYCLMQCNGYCVMDDADAYPAACGWFTCGVVRSFLVRQQASSSREIISYMVSVMDVGLCSDFRHDMVHA